MKREDEGRGRVIIREAREKDAARLLTAMREMIAQHRWVLTEPDELPKKVAEERAFIRRHRRARNSLLLIAEVDGEIVGVCGAHGGGRRRNSHSSELGIVLREEWTGRGLGKAMMQRILTWARRAGVTRLSLGVYASNRRAQALYRGLEFVKEGVARRSMRIGRRYYDTIMMARLL